MVPKGDSCNDASLSRIPSRLCLSMLVYARVEKVPRILVHEDQAGSSIDSHVSQWPQVGVEDWRPGSFRASSIYVWLAAPQFQIINLGVLLSRLIITKIAPRGFRCCALCFPFSDLFSWFKPKTGPSEEVDRAWSRTQSFSMAAVNGDHGPTQEYTPADSTSARKSNNHHATNGGSNALYEVTTYGNTRADINNLTVVYQPHPIPDADKYRHGVRRIDQDALDATQSMKSFFDFVANDRLRRMPHRGSRWDKILRWAEYFSAQVFVYHDVVGSFVPNSQEAAQLLWTSCRILLQVSERRAVGQYSEANRFSSVPNMPMRWRKSFGFSSK